MHVTKIMLFRGIFFANQLLFTLKRVLIEKYGAKCFIYSEPLDESLLQVDHRIPYEIGGERNEEDIDIYMLLSPSANRAKSWTCEHCANRTEKRSLHSNTIGLANTEKGQVLPASAIPSSPADGPVGGAKKGLEYKDEHLWKYYKIAQCYKGLENHKREKSYLVFKGE